MKTSGKTLIDIEIILANGVTTITPTNNFSHILKQLNKLHKKGTIPFNRHKKSMSRAICIKDTSLEISSNLNNDPIYNHTPLINYNSCHHHIKVQDSYPDSTKIG